LVRPLAVDCRVQPNHRELFGEKTAGSNRRGRPACRREFFRSLAPESVWKLKPVHGQNFKAKQQITKYIHSRSSQLTRIMDLKIDSSRSHKASQRIDKDCSFHAGGSCKKEKNPPRFQNSMGLNKLTDQNLICRNASDFN
jgi:hypothetical protein